MAALQTASTVLDVLARGAVVAMFFKAGREYDASRPRSSSVEHATASRDPRDGGEDGASQSERTIRRMRHEAWKWF